MNQLQLQLFEPDAETRAFIYQKVQALAPKIGEGGTVATVTRRSFSARADFVPRYLVEFVVAIQGQVIRVGARSKNVFEAVSNAAIRMEDVLGAFSEVSPGTDQERSPRTDRWQWLH